MISKMLASSMASLSKTSLSLLLIILFLSISSALDMSIINYDLPAATSPRSDAELTGIYEAWLVKHRKNYNAFGEKERRFQIFKDNVKYIDEQNNAGETRTYKLGLNKFADLTNEEYRSTYLGAKRKPEAALKMKKSSDRYLYKVGDELPGSVDWRENGAVAPVKDQGQCGSCWAFSAVAAVEGINQIVSGKLLTLSEQELIDCDKPHNSGCDGGLLDYAFEFIINNGGIDSDDDYPYKERDGTCDRYRKNSKVVTIDDFEDVPEYNEKALQKAVAHQSVSVAIEASSRAFQHYQSGVFTANCGEEIDHGVVIVGYGTTEHGIDFWTVRNSWGSDWGEDGYIRLERNLKQQSSGKCGIAIEPSYPIKTSPNPGPSPRSPLVTCDSYYSCRAGTTCCCVYQYGPDCFSWGCCPIESAVCCPDNSSCCPHDYPVCDTHKGTCNAEKNSPFSVKALKRSPAKFHPKLSSA